MDFKHRDRTLLTPREAEVLVLCQKGLTARQIAEKLSISKNNVKNRLKSIGERIRAREAQQA